MSILSAGSRAGRSRSWRIVDRLLRLYEVDCCVRFFCAGAWPQTLSTVMSDLNAVKKAIRPKTKLAWMETPSNPLLKIVDLAAVAKIIHEAGAVSVCDNTWAPVLQRPFELGADFILHSTTKYFGGHCDVLGRHCRRA